MMKNITTVFAFAFLFVVNHCSLYAQQGNNEKPQILRIEGESNDLGKEVYEYTYNTEGQLKTIISTQPQSSYSIKEERSYDNQGRLVRIEEWQWYKKKKTYYPANLYDFTYNRQGFLSLAEKKVNAGGEYVEYEDTSYEYNSNGLLVRETVYDYNNDIDARKIEYQYNAQNKLIRCEVFSASTNGNQALILHDARNYVYNSKGELTSIEYEVVIDGKLQKDKTRVYTYDSFGECIKVEDFLAGVKTPAVIYTFGYDKRFLASDIFIVNPYITSLPDLKPMKYMRTSVKIELVDVNGNRTEHAHYQYQYSHIAPPQPVQPFIALKHANPKGDQFIMVIEAKGELRFEGVVFDHNDEMGYPFYRILDPNNIKIWGEVTKLDVSNQRIKMLDVTAMPSLENLNYMGNNVGKVDLSKNPNLTTLNCSVTGISKLELSHNPKLVNLNCSGNQLTELDLSHNTLLEGVVFEGNKLTSLDVSKNNKLTYLACNDNLIESITFPEKNVLEVLYAHNNKLKTIPTQQLPLLTDLYCSGNESLSAIDLSNNPKLREFACEQTAICELNFSNNPNLYTLYCYKTNLEKLNLEGLAKLTVVNCAENPKLTTLNVTNCSALQKLYTDRTNLSELVLNGCSSLNILSVHTNKIKCEQMAHMVTTLPQANEVAKFFVIDTKNKAEKNECSKQTVKLATDKHWNVLDYANGDNKFEGVPFEGFDYGYAIFTENTNNSLYCYKQPYQLVIGRATPNSKILLFNSLGKCIQVEHANALGNAMFNTTILTHGTYIVQNNKQTIKVCL